MNERHPQPCPSHPGEVRDQRFAYLDALIEAGWGAVPMCIIEQEIERNNGFLPKRQDFRDYGY